MGTPEQVSLVSLEPKHSAEAIATLVAAFSDDPVERWMYPDAGQYATHFPTFVAAFGGSAFDDGTAWRLSCGSDAVALWMQPGTEADADEVVSLMQDTVAPDLHGDLFDVVEQMSDAHPHFPHWYLPWLGVAPASQGGGLGGRLLGACLEIVDRDGLPAYLETPNPRTIPLYARHGFVVTEVCRAGSCPPVTGMLRPAAAR
jgi:GNAT superfamily N-acetyltransferase